MPAAISVQRTLDPRLNLKNLTNALREVPDWEMLGCKLGIKEYKIKEIANDRSHRNPHLCKKDLLDHWMKSDVEASWEQMAAALDDMDEKTAASGIRAVYCSRGVTMTVITDSQNIIIGDLPKDILFAACSTTLFPSLSCAIKDVSLFPFRHMSVYSQFTAKATKCWNTHRQNCCVSQ